MSIFLACVGAVAGEIGPEERAVGPQAA